MFDFRLMACISRKRIKIFLKIELGTFMDNSAHKKNQIWCPPVTNWVYEWFNTPPLLKIQVTWCYPFCSLIYGPNVGFSHRLVMFDIYQILIFRLISKQFLFFISLARLILIGTLHPPFHIFCSILNCLLLSGLCFPEFIHYNPNIFYVHIKLFYPQALLHSFQPRK